MIGVLHCKLPQLVYSLVGLDGLANVNGDISLWLVFQVKGFQGKLSMSILFFLFVYFTSDEVFSSCVMTLILIRLDLSLKGSTTWNMTYMVLLLIHNNGQQGGEIMHFVFSFFCCKGFQMSMECVIESYISMWI